MPGEVSNTTTAEDGKNMLQKLFYIPDTFEHEELRRRQVINFILVILVVIAFPMALYSLATMLGSGPSLVIIVTLIANLALLFANRSPRMPSWLSATILTAILLFAISLSDTPAELYNGRSIVIWALPILIGALIFPPRVVFLIFLVIAGLMEAFPPPNNVGVNYFAMSVLLIITVMSWAGMTIANRAIRDARREAGNNHAILNSIADGVLVLDGQGRFISANPALFAMIPEADLQEILKQPLGNTLEWKKRLFSINASVVPEVGTVAIFRDETRRRETERAKDAILAVTSHELRTPLSSMKSYVEMLQDLVLNDRYEKDHFVKQIQRILENVDRLDRLVANILDYAQLQSDTFTLKHEPFNIRAVLDKSGRLLSGMLESKSLTYKVTVDSNVPAAMIGDANRLQHVLTDLIGNAIKFTERGNVGVNVSLSGQSIAFRVTDTGPGIPPEQLPDIFEAFRRGSDYASRTHQGVGLGLPIARQIVTHMGGSIDVSSEVGRGTSVTITVPITI